MPPLLRPVVGFFTSLRLTVVLLALSILLVWVATIMQQYYGIRYIETEYFHSFIARIQQPGSHLVIPLPGGYLVGGLLFLNLLFSQFTRIPLRWNKLGIHLVHTGIQLLLVGELYRGLGTQESQMRLDEGGSSRFTEDIHEQELAIVDKTSPDHDVVHSVPLGRLSRTAPVAIPGTGLVVRPQAFFPNSEVMLRRDAPNAPASPATAGFGPQVVVVAQAVTYRSDEINTPSVYFELAGDGTSLGTWLASLRLTTAQEFTHNGRRYEFSLRRLRHYQDFTLTLLDFRHDKYPGTEIPKNFSSLVRLRSDDGKEDREVKIYMNNPLRYGGLTFYQASFDNNDTTSILQVVRNAGWTVPYIACVVASIGLLFHFVLSLVAFLQKRSAPRQA